MTNYRFPVKRVKVPEFKSTGYITTESEPREEMTLIQGQMPRSKEEWRVSVALNKMKVRYQYQYPIGRWGMRGSYMVDFYVQAVPAWFPLEVQSERWHTGGFAREERLRQAIIERTLNAVMRFVWEDDLQSIPDAMTAVQKVLQDPVVRRL